MCKRLTTDMNGHLAETNIKTSGAGSDVIRTEAWLGAEETTTNRPKPVFELGRVFITRRVLEHFSLRAIDEFLRSYAAMEGGELSDIARANEVALWFGGPIFSFWRDGASNEVYVVTDADRSRTVVMMEEERGVPARPAEMGSVTSGRSPDAASDEGERTLIQAV